MDWEAPRQELPGRVSAQDVAGGARHNLRVRYLLQDRRQVGLVLLPSRPTWLLVAFPTMLDVGDVREGDIGAVALPSLDNFVQHGFFFLPSSLESGSVGVPASSFSLFSFPDPPPALHCLSFSSQSDLERTALKTFFS